LGNNTATWGEGYFNQRSTNGNLDYMYIPYSPRYYAYYKAPFSLSASTICLGTGNTPVTYEDFKLSGNAISITLSAKSSTTLFNQDTKKYQRVVVCTCSNLTGQDVTISEWGIFRQNSSSGSSVIAYSNSASNCVLLYREVLETPITIKAGTTSTLTFKVDIPMPNHP
jgi:hypothetical protein